MAVPGTDGLRMVAFSFRAGASASVRYSSGNVVTEGKDSRFVSLSRRPWNGEPPPELLVAAEVTPAELFYVRSHAPVPAVDPGSYRLEVAGQVRTPLRLSLGELRERFPVREVTATLHCAGNRRRELMDVRPIPGEEPWGISALGNARWGGTPLAAVLEAAGVGAGAAHVAFQGLDRVEKEGEVFGFGGSIPLDRALRSPDVLLAWEMNGAPLPPAHGFPVRVVVPGTIGARSVKWLSGIEVRGEPSDNHFQRRAYKLFPPDVGPEEADWKRGLMLDELSVSSAICRPAAGAEVPAGRVAVRGWATAGGDRTVARVEVSWDGGRRWVVAEHPPVQPGAWSLWHAELDLPPGEHELLCRARDSAANTQPERTEPLWNFKGYMNNAWHRVRVRAR